nr:zinc finger, CCHC-type [Tanacetum cinerariifolium]
MFVKPVWRKKLNYCNTSNKVDVNLPTPMPKPQSLLKEQSQENPHTTQSTHDSLQSHLFLLGDPYDTNVEQDFIPPPNTLRIREEKREKRGKTVYKRNMGFNESGEYKKTFIAFSVDTCLMQVLHGFEFEVKPLGDHTFEVEPQENVDQRAGYKKYREYSNEAAFVVGVAEKIYPHESLTFNNTFACEVIPKWKAGLKEDMNVRLDVYVLSNGYRKSSDDSDGYYWECTPMNRSPSSVIGFKKPIDMLEIFGWLASIKQGMLEPVKVKCIFLRYHKSIVGNKLWRLKANLQHMEALSTTKAGYMTFIEAWEKEIWLKGLLTESGYELSLEAVRGCVWRNKSAPVERQ